MSRLDFFKQQRKKYPQYLNPRIEIWIDEDVVKVGKNVSIRAGCTIGTQGFGYEWDGKEELQIPHVGRVIIGDNVIIHEMVHVARGTVDNTVIGDGTRIDSLVHVAHNVRIGKHCLITAGVIIAGSVTIGDHTQIGPGTSIIDHVKIGNNVLIGVGAVVITDIPDNQVWVGNPARYLRDNEVK